MVHREAIAVLSYDLVKGGHSCPHDMFCAFGFFFESRCVNRHWQDHKLWDPMGEEKGRDLWDVGIYVASVYTLAGSFRKAPGPDTAFTTKYGAICSS